MNKKWLKRRQRLLASGILWTAINYVVGYDFYNTAEKIIHLSNPLCLIASLQFFGNFLILSSLRYKVVKRISPNKEWNNYTVTCIKDWVVRYKCNFAFVILQNNIFVHTAQFPGCCTFVSRVIGVSFPLLFSV